MAKLNEVWERFKGSFMVVLAALAALAAVLTTTDLDDHLCAKWAMCKDAYDQGQAANTGTPLPTAVK